MKTWQKGTALHIAVFLLTFGGGCYTTLRSPSHLTDSVVNETQYEQSEWDFGRGWYYHSHAVGSNYFYYHSMPWWYNRNRNAVIGPVIDLRDTSLAQDGKINRRNFDNPVIENTVLPLMPYIPVDSTSTVKHQETPTDSTVVIPPNKTQENNNNSTQEKKNNTDKVNHRGRR